MSDVCGPRTYNRCMIDLHFTAGDAPKAIQFYTDVLGVKERMRFESADKKHILHAELQLGDTVIFLGDMPFTGPEAIEQGPANATLYTYVSDVDTIYATALKHGAAGKAPPSDQFYGDRRAIFKDPFGNQWVVAKRLEQQKSAEELQNIIETRAKAAAASESIDTNDSCCSAAKSAPSDQKCSDFDLTTANADLARWKKMSQIHHSKVSERKPKEIVSESEWRDRHGQHHLLAEKALTHHKDYLASLRQQLPWTEYNSDYVFEDIHGKKVPFLDLFSNPNYDDLIIYNLMLPNSREKDECCPMCASWVDNFNGNLFVLQQKINVAIIARGSPSLLSEFSKRRGWSSNLPLFSSSQSTFHFDKGYSITNEQYDEFKKLLDENNGNGAAALTKLKEINPQHPNATANFGRGIPYLVPNRGGTLVLHLDRKNNKIYKTFVFESRGAECMNAAWNLFDLLPYGREGFFPKV